MDTKDKMKWSLETGVRTQERAQFYSVTLAFTVLALSVQTVEINESIAIYEAAASITLFVSGMSGLLRLLFIPKIYKLDVLIQSLIYEKNDPRNISIPGIDTSKTDSNINELNSDKDKTNKKLKILMRVHINSLIMGLILLIVSRVFVPAFTILNASAQGGAS